MAWRLPETGLNRPWLPSGWGPLLHLIRISIPPYFLSSNKCYVKLILQQWSFISIHQHMTHVHFQHRIKSYPWFLLFRFSSVLCREIQQNLSLQDFLFPSSLLPQLNWELQFYFPQVDAAQVLACLSSKPCYHLASCANHHPLQTQEIQKHQAPVNRVISFNLLQEEQFYLRKVIKTHI